MRRGLMGSRYLTNALFIAVGAFLIVTSRAFAVGVFMWLMFGCGIGVLALAAAISGRASRGGPQRALDGAASLLGAWTIVASMVFAGVTVTWLGFASGIALFILALTGLTVHELRTERVVHALEISSPVPTGDLAASH